MKRIINKDELLNKMKQGIDCSGYTYAHNLYPVKGWVVSYSDYLLETIKLGLPQISMEEFKVSHLQDLPF